MSSLCNICKFNTIEGLKKGGVPNHPFDFTVALAGNPNTGKSTVFNNLTGLRQHTGNWPGKTVSSAMGGFTFIDKHFELVDLPGTYSLLSTSEDEEIARDYILFSEPDVTIIVADASRLERNLNLTLQILEITDKAILCVNLMDEAKRHGIEIDERTLARDLGIPVVLTSARTNKGMDELLRTVYDMATGKIKNKPRRIKGIPKKTNDAIEKLKDELLKINSNLPNSRWIAMRMLEGDRSVIQAMKEGKLFKNNETAK